MSYFRPPKSSAAVVWAGRAAAVTGIAWGVLGFMSANPAGIAAAWASLPSLTTAAGLGSAFLTFSPLILGAGSGLAVLRNAEKAAEVNRDDTRYQRRLQTALSHGKSETHLEPRMLSQNAQASTLTTGLGTMVSMAWFAVGLLTLAGGAMAAINGGSFVMSELFETLGIASKAAPLVAAATGAATMLAGVASWKVTGVAAEARDFAFSREAAAERGRITHERQQAHAHAAAPTIAHAATPLSDAIDRQLKSEERQADAATGGHVERLLAEQGQHPTLGLRA